MPHCTFRRHSANVRKPTILLLLCNPMGSGVQCYQLSKKSSISIVACSNFSALVELEKKEGSQNPYAVVSSECLISPCLFYDCGVPVFVLFLSHPTQLFFFSFFLFKISR